MTGKENIGISSVQDLFVVVFLWFNGFFLVKKYYSKSFFKTHSKITFYSISKETIFKIVKKQKYFSIFWHIFQIIADLVVCETPIHLEKGSIILLNRTFPISDVDIL